MTKMIIFDNTSDLLGETRDITQTLSAIIHRADIVNSFL